MEWLDSLRIGISSITLVIAFLLGGSRDANADLSFGEPTPVPNVNTSFGEGWPDISADGLELYFNSDRPGCQGGLLGDIYVSTRLTTKDGWGEPVNLGSTVNSRFNDAAPSISADGLTLYFSGWGFSNFRPGGLGECDVWMTTRAATDVPWGEPVNLGSTINSSYHDVGPCISIDGLSLYFGSFRSGNLGGGDLYVATRASTEDDWGTPVWLGSTVNSSSVDGLPAISPDGRILFFYRSPAPYHICMTSRATTNDDWDAPVTLGPPISDAYSIGSPAISADGRTLYFHSERPGGSGGFDIWQAPVLPIVDFNGNGKVDGRDVAIMTEYWGEDEPVCDIGPMPWGDSIVDVQDLLVLAEYIGEEVDDPTLVAHWALDETDGIVAYDSRGINDGVLQGGATWQLGSGMVDGALGFDGVDDCVVVSNCVLNPVDGPFSVLARVKGGAAGQVLVSQAGGNDWLLIDSSGALMTDLKGAGRKAKALYSETVITDDQWHRIALTWDGTRRELCVDGILVAGDEPGALPDLLGGFHIGAGAILEAGTFFIGLIDDVRIYNRAVRP